MSSKDAAKVAHRKSARGEYIETDTGNKISRRALITGTPHITLAGRVVVSAHVVLRGDLVPSSAPATTGTNAQSAASPRTAIAVSRYTFIGPHATLHPPYRLMRSGETTYMVLRVGENVYISEGAYVAAAQVGNNVFIGREAVVGNCCILRDGCKVLEGSVLPDGMVVPSGVVVGGRPARIIGDVPDAFGVGGGSGVRGEPSWVEGGELRELIRSVR